MCMKKNKTVFQANKRSMNDSSVLQRTRYCSCCNFINEFGTSNRKSNLLVQRIHYLPLDRAALATHVNPCGTFILQRQQRKYVPWTHYGFWFHVDWININFNDTCVFEAIKLALDVMPNERRNFFVFNYSIFFLLWWLQHMCIVFKSVTKYNKTTILFCFEFIGPLQESINSYICTRYESINWNMISCWNICYYCFSKIRSWIGHVASNYMSIYW